MFFSGGGSPWLPEMQLADPGVMLSYHMTVALFNYKPDTRIRRLLKARKKAKKKGKKK